MPERPPGDLSGRSAPSPRTPPTGRPNRRLDNVGGTSGGGGEFVLGLALLALGGWLFIGNMQVSSFMWGRLPGGISLGLVFLPLFVGVALLFFDARSKLGWLAVTLAIALLFVGVFSSLKVWFRPTSLTRTLGMLGALAAGIGLVARALRPRA